MKHRRYIWFFAAVCVLAAIGTAQLRYAFSRARNAQTNATAAEALAFLQSDPALSSAAAQDAVRAAATEAARTYSAGRVLTPESAFVLGMQFQRENNLAAAESLFRDVIEAYPGWYRGYEALGTLLGQNAYGREDEAEDALRKTIELAPDSGRAHNLLALLLRSENRIPEAETEALEALRLMPGDVAAHNNYANLLVVMERYAEARIHYEEAVALDPSHPKPYYNLACLHAIEGRSGAALTSLDAALSLAPAMRQDAELDSDLDNIRGIAEFNRLVYGAANRTISARD